MTELTSKPERQDWEARQKEKSKGNGKMDPTIAVTMLRQAAVRAEHLTGDENWDYFLSLIQSFIEETIRQQESAQDFLDDPNVLGHEELLRAKNAVLMCKDRVRLLNTVMELPKDIIKVGNEAVGIQERMD